MNFSTLLGRWARIKNGALGMFNLNDPQWGRGDDSGGEKNPPQNNGQQRPPKKGDGPNNPDLDDLWRDFNDKLGKLFGGGGSGRGSRPGGAPPERGRGGGNSGGFLVVGAAGALLCIWLFSGFFVVREGEQAVVTRFGNYQDTVGAGWRWRMPYPIERHEVVVVTELRSVDVGNDRTIIPSTGLREPAMLTEDENIVEVKFAVQYRLNDARAYLFESSNPEQTVVQAAETAVREVVGKMAMDKVLAEEREQIAPRVRVLMQTILDRYKVGIEVVNINLQQGGIRAPEQVQAAFDDVLKAGQEREKVKNEAEAYANDVVPRAVGTASRMKAEAEGYRSRIVSQAQGDAQRFKAVLAEYQKAPQVMRDRMYIDTMQQIYSNVTKVIVDSKQGSNLLYLPLDKLMESARANTSTAGASSNDAASPAVAGNTGTSMGNAASSGSVQETRGVPDNGRTRDRERR